jgi:hypothetical protein
MLSCIYRHYPGGAIELPPEKSKIVYLAMEQNWLDEDTALKAAALKGVGGSSPSCSATFQSHNPVLRKRRERVAFP